MGLCINMGLKTVSCPTAHVDLNQFYLVPFIFLFSCLFCAFVAVYDYLVQPTGD